MKYLILISTDYFLGGAQIRYLSIYQEIACTKDDYILVVNRSLYEIANKAGLLPTKRDNIKILEIDKPFLLKPPNNNHTRVVRKKPISDNPIKQLFSSLLTLRRMMKYSLMLKKVFAKDHPDYIYAIWIGGMIAWPLKYIYKFKLTYSYMDSGFSSLESFLKHPLKCERLPLLHANTIDFLSEDLYKGVNERVKLNTSTKIAIAPCSFKNFSEFQPAKQKLQHVVFCSRLTPIKNPLLFLQSISVFNQVYKHNKQVKFLVLGDGACIDDLKEYKAKENLANVTFKGFVDHPINYLQESMIFVSIQKANNYPSQSLLEAMACENAIIASDVGETRKLVTEKEGVLVKLDAKEIAEAINRLISEPDLCLMLGRNARQKVLSDHNKKKYMDYFYSLETE